MKELLKSKIMIGFVVFMLGFTYVNAVGMKDLENKEEDNLVVFVG